MRYLRTLAMTLGGLLVLCWAVIAFSNRARLLVDEQYFAHQPQARTRKLALFSVLGFLRPARMQVEPRVSLKLYPLDLISRSILKYGSWQPEVWDSLNSSLCDSAVLLDVGAHIGYFSLKGAAKVGPRGRVVSFEPNPETLDELRANIDASHVDSIVTVQPIACSDRDQQLTLYASRIWNTGSSSLSKENAGNFDDAPKPYQVRGRPIDDVVRELRLQRVDAIKIDVEGAEVSVLRGAMETLKRFHPKVVMEIVAEQLASLGTKPDDVFGLLRQAGYDAGKKIDGVGDWEFSWLRP